MTKKFIYRKNFKEYEIDNFKKLLAKFKNEPSDQTG